MSRETTPTTPGAQKRCSLEDAKRTIDDFLEQQLGEVPSYDIDDDGERCWSFWVLDEDTTSYVHPDLRIEWYGTGHRPQERR